MLSSAPRRRHGAACARPQQVVYELKYVQACPNLFNRLYGRVRERSRRASIPTIDLILTPTDRPGRR